VDKDKWGIKDDQLEGFKIAYKNLFIKSREFNLSIEKQDEMLERLVNEKFIEALHNLIAEDPRAKEEESMDFYDELKELMNQWKNEFEHEEKMKRKWWKFWSR